MRFVSDTSSMCLIRDSFLQTMIIIEDWILWRFVCSNNDLSRHYLVACTKTINYALWFLEMASNFSGTGEFKESMKQWGWKDVKSFVSVKNVQNAISPVSGENLFKMMAEKKFSSKSNTFEMSNLEFKCLGLFITDWTHYFTAEHVPKPSIVL